MQGPRRRPWRWQNQLQPPQLTKLYDAAYGIIELSIQQAPDFHRLSSNLGKQMPRLSVP
jgi:hypothetical protein